MIKPHRETSRAVVSLQRLAGTAECGIERQGKVDVRPPLHGYPRAAVR